MVSFVLIGSVVLWRNGTEFLSKKCLYGYRQTQDKQRPVLNYLEFYTRSIPRKFVISLEPLNWSTDLCEALYYLEALRCFSSYWILLLMLKVRKIHHDCLWRTLFNHSIFKSYCGTEQNQEILLDIRYGKKYNSLMSTYMWRCWYMQSL